MYNHLEERRVDIVTPILFLLLIGIIVGGGWETIQTMHSILKYNEIMARNTYLMCNMTNNAMMQNVQCLKI